MKLDSIIFDGIFGQILMITKNIKSEKANVISRIISIMQDFLIFLFEIKKYTEIYKIMKDEINFDCLFI